MASAIQTLETNIDTTSFLDEISNPSVVCLWKSYGKEFYAFKHTETIIVKGTEAVSRPTEQQFRNGVGVRDYSSSLFPHTMSWIQQRFTNVQRVCFIKLYPSQKVHPHRDEGEYFKHIQRHHLCISGNYEYSVGSEKLNVKPGTLFTFDSSLLHGTVNLTNKERITLVFDTLKP